MRHSSSTSSSVPADLFYGLDSQPYISIPTDSTVFLRVSPNDASSREIFAALPRESPSCRTMLGGVVNLLYIRVASLFFFGAGEGNIIGVK